ncbi:MAG: Non-specific serine/threonine protein kinase, partial [Frankiales bacterium]|nr:Non-specific serine/threonine protein kinase [Frankiales bacterium]
ALVGVRAAPPVRSLLHRPHSRALRLALPLLLVVLVAVAARAFFAGSGRSVEVPQVRAGSSAVEAQRLLLDAGFSVRWRTQVDAEVPEGRVVRTLPDAGTRAPEGSSVAVVTSGEPLLGRPYSVVRDALARRGLTFRPVVDGEDGAPGTVSRLEPDGPLVPGEEILVHVVPGGQGRESGGRGR